MGICTDHMLIDITSHALNLIESQVSTAKA